MAIKKSKEQSDINYKTFYFILDYETFIVVKAENIGIAERIYKTTFNTNKAQLIVSGGELIQDKNVIRRNLIPTIQRLVNTSNPTAFSIGKEWYALENK